MASSQEEDHNRPSGSEPEQVFGLGKFVNDYRKKLTKLREKILVQRKPRGVPLPLVLLTFDGPTTFDCPPWPKKVKKEKIDKFLVESVYPTLFCSGKTFTDKRQEGPLMDNVIADHLFFLHAVSQPTMFFETMQLLDPMAEGNCGFIVLQFFALFLKEGHKSLRGMRK